MWLFTANMEKLKGSAIADTKTVYNHDYTTDNFTMNNEEIWS